MATSMAINSISPYSPLIISSRISSFSSLSSSVHTSSPSSSRSSSYSSSSSSSLSILANTVGVAIATSAFIIPEAVLSASLTNEPSNALSLPTWAIHVSSVAEWATAMILVWEYGDKTGFEAWKGLSWGMVPLLGGALCACTWHFFYNSEALEVLVALQAALTVIGNITMCFAAFRIFRASQGDSKGS